MPRVMPCWDFTGSGSVVLLTLSCLSNDHCVRRGAVPTVKEYGKAFDTAIPYAENQTATEDGVHRRDLGRTVREPAQKQRFVSLIFS